MDHRQLIEFMNKIEKLKCNTRHSYTTSGRKESVAEHCWRLGVMAMLVSDEFSTLDMNKVIKMALIHDLGEAITGDVASFYKTDDNRRDEARAIEDLISMLPEPHASEFRELFDEMAKRETPEAKLLKALDNTEAVIAHNEADISTWIPLEYSENLVYGEANCAWHPWLVEFRKMLKQDSIDKINEAK